jgi:lipid A 3-O-deacylase
MGARKSFTCKALVMLLSLAGGIPASQAADWVSFTWDSDLFVGSDDGYTNGGFLSWFDTGRRSNRQPEPPVPVVPLLWSMSTEKDPLYTVNAHTLGQMMVTPEDIKAEHPNPDDLPYAGLFYYVSSHLKVYERYADMASVTLGLVGPASGAESVQRYIHSRFDYDEPRGWSHQLENELVFKLSRDRVWRTWASHAGNADLVMSAGINVGTLESSVGGYAIIRYGTNLAKSYATAAYHSSRAINPLALDGGWHVYFGLGGRYVGNLIFTDGNTYRDSPSVDLDPAKIGVSCGVSYSWQTIAMTLAFEDAALFEEQYEAIERYGTLTFAYRLE